MARWLIYQHDFGFIYTDDRMTGTKKTVLARGSFGEDTYGTRYVKLFHNLIPIDNFQKFEVFNNGLHRSRDMRQLGLAAFI